MAAALVIGGVIVWSVLSRGTGSSPTLTGAASDSVVASVTSIPAGVFDTVGTGGIADPMRRTTLEQQTGPGGRPVFIYVGAEYCPYCASQKWSVVAALSRFGTFEGLELSTSPSGESYPNTPTFTFRGVRYQSQYIELSAVETADREGRPLTAMNDLQKRAMDRSNSRGSIPFVSVAERYVAVGSGYRIDVLSGKTWSQVADQMRDPGTPLARAVLGNTNWITSAICEQTGGKPSSVCSSPAVAATKR